jgi:adenine deaminase
MRIEDKIALARGEGKVDLLLSNCRMVNVFSGRVERASVAIAGDIIIGIGDYRAKRVIDLKGAHLAPGFMDAHVHIESSMVTVPEYARAVVPHGTTTVIIDPHEIANIFGVNGIRYMINSSRGCPLNVFIMLSSCVPSSGLETSGADLTSRDLAFLWGEEQVLGLAEMMNYPGVLNRDPEVMAKIRAAGDSPIDGHAPGLSGKDLNAYIVAGIRSDHECSTLSEAREKLARGMFIMLREGTAAKNLKALLPLCTPRTWPRCLFATDDRHPDDLIAEGHIDFMIRTAIRAGIDPVDAIRMGTLNTALYFGLSHLGAIAPGYQADLVVFDDFKNFNIERVFKSGRQVARKKKLTMKGWEPKLPHLRGSVNVDWLGLGEFSIKAENEKAKVIGVVPGELITKKLMLSLKIKDGFAISDPRRDILKIAVIERHTASGRVGLGFVRGFGLRSGALASSVAHDSHNIIVVGTNDGDMMTAAIEVVRMSGGQVVVDHDEIKAALPLPIAGLISPKPLPEVRRAITLLNKAAHDLGSPLKDPFMTLSFMALPPIPALKITDKGLVDAVDFKLVPLYGER